jgi:hypothetical protein
MFDQIRQLAIKYINATNVWSAADWGGEPLLGGRGLHVSILQA